jgi:hypothetical protein
MRKVEEEEGTDYRDIRRDGTERRLNKYRRREIRRKSEGHAQRGRR